MVTMGFNSFLSRTICCFIPSRSLRHKCREHFKRYSVQNILVQFDALQQKYNSLIHDANEIKIDLQNKYNTCIDNINKISRSENIQSKAIEEINNKLNMMTRNFKFNVSGTGNVILIFDKKTNEYVKCEDGVPQLFLTVRGNNNEIKIGCPEILDGFSLEIYGDNNKVHLGKADGDYFFIRSTAFIIGGNNSEIIIGDNMRINSGSFFTVFESGVKLHIGNNFRCAEKVVIYASDAHPIIDIKTKQILNVSKKSVKLGNNVWLGYGCFLTKRASLPDFTIVGAHSVVTKEFTESYTSVCGNPAKVVKTGLKRLDLWEEILNNK